MRYRFALLTRFVCPGAVRVLTLTLALALVALVPTTHAQARKEVSGVSVFSGVAKATPVGPDHLILTWESTGVANTPESQGGPFMNNSFRCVGANYFVGGKGRFTGYCHGVDPAGDQWVSEFTTEEVTLGAPSSKGEVTLIGGTGKFKGMKHATETESFNMRPVTDGTFQGYTKWRGWYELQP